MDDIKIIPAGTIIRLNGVPLRLCGDSRVESSDSNYKLALSQDEHFSSNPVQAPSPVNFPTTRQ